jgi:hypothetical protein
MSAVYPLEKRIRIRSFIFSMAEYPCSQCEARAYNAQPRITADWLDGAAQQAESPLGDETETGIVRTGIESYKCPAKRLLVVGGIVD